MLALSDEIKMRGFKVNPQILKISDSLIDVGNKLQNIDENKKINQVCKTNIEDVKLAVKYFFSENYKIHDIPYLSFYHLRKNTNIPVIKMVDPFELPLFFENHPESLFFGYLIAKLINETKRKVFFTGIVINDIITELSVCSYAHEITHSLLDSLKGAINDYYNSEILSEFTELIVAHLLSDDERILRTYDSYRVHEFNYLINRVKNYKPAFDDIDDVLEDCKYVTSMIRTYNLFSEYYYGSEGTKQYIISRINEIFAGKSTVEELLSEFMDVSEPSQSLTFSKKAFDYFERKN